MKKLYNKIHREAMHLPSILNPLELKQYTKLSTIHSNQNGTITPMNAKIIDGKKISQDIQKKISIEIKKRLEKGLKTPGLAVILVGENKASQIYVKNKQVACKNVGIYSKQLNLPNETSEKELLKIINELNHDENIHGILVQLPLPKQIDPNIIIESINPDKDVDGFHPYNLGRLAQKNPTLRPCTAYGIINLLKTTNINLEGKNAVVVGRSNIVGLPISLELLNENCTVTICHSYTKNLSEKIKEADIVIAAIGKPNSIKGNWIKDGAIVIDVGMNRLNDGKLVGDVEFDLAKEHANWITPVPGGVGPMTIAMLLSNVLQAALLQN